MQYSGGTLKQDSDERLRDVVEHVTEGILVAQDGRFRYANPAALALTGYTMAEIDGVEFLPMVHPEDRPRVIDHHTRRLRGDPVEPRYDFRVLTKSGEARWVQLAAVMIDWDGRPATLSFISDISERKQAEEALRRSESRYRSVVEGAPIGVVIVQDNQLKYVNPEFARMVGNTAEDLLSRRSILERVHPEDRERMTELARAAVGRPTGDTLRVVYRILRDDDSTLSMDVSSVQIEWEGRRATLAFIQDLSERLRLEDDLKRSLAERELILENSVVGIAFLTPDGRLKWANRVMAQVFGAEPEGMEGKSLEAYYPSREVYIATGAAVSAAVLAGRTYEAELRMRRADGALFWAQLSGKAINATDLSQGTVWVVHDISARKQAEEEIRAMLEKQRELNQLKSRFVSMTSHEFRTPLATILSSSQLLRRYGARLPESERGELFDTIETAVRRMTTMLEDILFIGRAESDRLAFSPAPLQLAPFCERLVAEARAAAPKREFALVVVDALVNLDEKLLRHILDNLLANAVKYSPGGGTIMLAARAEGGSASFTVSDAGIGMAQDELPRLFEAFYRASNAGGISGTGLGLSIVKQCVDLHRGTIEIDTELGRGTRFTVRLPAG